MNTIAFITPIQTIWIILILIILAFRLAGCAYGFFIPLMGWLLRKLFVLLLLTGLVAALLYFVSGGHQKQHPHNHNQSLNTTQS